MTTTSPTRTVAEFAAALRFDDIPDEVVEHARVCVLDTIGCGLFGAVQDWSRIVTDVAARPCGGPAVVWGTAVRTTPFAAALANGTAVHGFELDDLHRRSIVHPGSVVLTAALAAADSRDGVSGRELLTAVVAGYEVAARVGMSVGTAHLLAGWHPTGTHGTLGAAAAAGSVFGLDAGRMQHALGIAGPQAGGLMAAQFSSMVKRMHAGRAAQSGVYAALLARAGFTGIRDLFESRYGGYCGTFSPEWNLAELTSGLGSRWETLSVGFKPFSTNGSCHTSIETVLELKKAHGFTASDVDQVVVHTSTATKEHVGWPYEPDSVTTAQMNLPYIIAVSVTDGDAFIYQFTPERIRDPELVALSRRVVVTADPDIDARGHGHRHESRVAIRLHDGRRFEGTRLHGLGSHERPLQRQKVHDKFRRLASAALPDDRVEALLTGVSELDSLPSTQTLTSALAS